VFVPLLGFALCDSIKAFQMPGLSQLELDALCVDEEALSDSPPSPIGTALLARKRQRQGLRLELSATSAIEVDPLATFPATLCNIDATESGLSQAVLDELSAPGQPTEDACDSSPFGTALLCAKTRRRWGAAWGAARSVQVSVAEEALPSPALPLSCPASWGNGGGGYSQAELDVVMCAEGKSTPAEEVRSPAQTVPSPRRTATGSPQIANHCLLSPPMRRKGRLGRRADAENVGGISVSPNKGKDMTSPGTRDMLSPQRRSPCVNPLSPVGLN